MTSNRSEGTPPLRSSTPLPHKEKRNNPRKRKGPVLPVRSQTRQGPPCVLEWGGVDDAVYWHFVVFKRGLCVVNENNKSAATFFPLC